MMTSNKTGQKISPHFLAQFLTPIIVPLDKSDGPEKISGWLSRWDTSTQTQLAGFWSLSRKEPKREFKLATRTSVSTLTSLK